MDGEEISSSSCLPQISLVWLEGLEVSRPDGPNLVLVSIFLKLSKKRPTSGPLDGRPGLIQFWSIFLEMHFVGFAVCTKGA